MNPAVGIALLLTGPPLLLNVGGRPRALQVSLDSEGGLLVPALQVASGQKVTSLTACLQDQSLRLDCRHENVTKQPMQYEFSLTRDAKKHVLSGNLGVPEHTYRTRTNFTSGDYIKVLRLSSFTTKDEGIYTCELRSYNQPHVPFNMNISVLRDKLVKCGGTSLLAQDALWLLLPLLSLPFLHAMDLVSL